MNWILVFPIIIPLITAVCVLFAWHNLFLQRVLAFVGCLILLITNCSLLKMTLNYHYVVAEVGSWPAPYGIVLISDVLSSMLIVVESIIAICVIIYSWSEVDKACCKAGFYPAYCVLLAGVSGAFLTGDLFNLYVWFEVILIASFVLLTLHADNFQLEAAVKYAVMNLIATLILLTAIAFIYGLTGTLNMADLAQHLSQSSQTGLITTIATIFIIAFGIKAALFPLFFWLPASYHTPTFSTSAIFAGLLSKVGVYALFRTFTLLFLSNQAYLHHILLVIAVMTLLVGIISSLSQNETRRTLSFSLISHIGFMILGLAIFTPLALIGSIFYLIQHMLVKTQLFLSSGLIRIFSGSTFLRRSGGLYQSYPFFSALFFIAGFSLAGVPPFSGFWGKLSLLKASFQAHDYGSMAVILFVGLMTIYMFARLWQAQFLHPPQNQDSLYLSGMRKIGLMLPVTILTVLILFIGLIPSPLYHIAQLASSQLLHPDQYIAAVLGVPVNA